MLGKRTGTGPERASTSWDAVCCRKILIRIRFGYFPELVKLDRGPEGEQHMPSRGGHPGRADDGRDRGEHTGHLVGVDVQVGGGPEINQVGRRRRVDRGQRRDAHQHQARRIQARGVERHPSHVGEKVQDRPVAGRGVRHCCCLLYRGPAPEHGQPARRSCRKYRRRTLGVAACAECSAHISLTACCSALSRSLGSTSRSSAVSFTALVTAFFTASLTLLSPTTTRPAWPGSMKSPSCLAWDRDMPLARWPLTPPMTPPAAAAPRTADGNRTPTAAPAAMPHQAPWRVAVSSLFSWTLPLASLVTTAAS